MGPEPSSQADRCPACLPQGPKCSCRVCIMCACQIHCSNNRHTDAALTRSLAPDCSVQGLCPRRAHHRQLQPGQSPLKPTADTNATTNMLPHRAADSTPCSALSHQGGRSIDPPGIAPCCPLSAVRLPSAPTAAADLAAVELGLLTMRPPQAALKAYSSLGSSAGSLLRATYLQGTWVGGAHTVGQQRCE